MHDATQLAVKAAIIESAAVEARIQAADPAFTAIGAAGLHHTWHALAYAVSVLTAEPVATVRERIQTAARDKVQLADYSPRRIA